MEVIFCTPSLDHRVCLDFLNSSIRTDRLLRESGIAVGHLQYGGDPYLAKVRSKLVSDFLDKHPTATDLFFLDDDIGWPAEKVREFVLRTEDVVAGIYPKKQDTLSFPCQIAGDERGGVIERNGLVKAISLPTGFLRIKRHVLQALADKSAKFKELNKDGTKHEYYNIFEMGLGPDGDWWGEDHALSQRMIELGFDLWIDPNIPFTHRGSKAWAGTLGAHLTISRASVKAPEMVQ